MGILPILSLLISVVLSNILNCSTEYADENICKIGGSASGSIVYDLFVIGFYAFYTIPIGLTVSLIAGIVYLSSRKKTKAS